MGRPPIGKVAMTGAERVRRHRLKHRAGRAVTKPVTIQAGDATDVARLNARIRELEAEHRREKDRADFAMRHIKEMGKKFAAALRAARPPAAPPKPARTPLPPDEQREREIKGLRTRVRNLAAELRHTREQAKNQGMMDRPTRILIAKVLHPDGRANATEAERNEACARFNDWANRKDKARRRQ
jgi:hypothetical protein